MHRSNLADYRGTEFDRGHMCPVADVSSEEELEDSFYFSNVCPQNPSCNRGVWKRLEKHVRNLTLSADIVHVYTGPLYKATQHSDGKKYVQYEVIGENDVAVPTHFFKVVFIKTQESYIQTEAYLIPNEKSPSDIPLDTFFTTIENIEKIAGIIFPAH